MDRGLQVVDATADDAERAAARWRRGEGLSLADRFCLALGARLGQTVWTADTASAADGDVSQIRWCNRTGSGHRRRIEDEEPCVVGARSAS